MSGVHPKHSNIKTTLALRRSDTPRKTRIPTTLQTKRSIGGIPIGRTGRVWASVWELSKEENRDRK